MQAFRVQEVTDWARRLMNSGFVVLDTETSGKGITADLLQVSIIDHCGEVLLNTYLKPEKPIDEAGKAFSVNHISNSMVERSPCFLDAYDLILSAVAGREVVIYNADFDVEMLDFACQKAGKPLIKAEWHCAMKQFARYVGETGRYGTWKWHRLRDACMMMAVAEEPTHDGLADCRATLALMRVLAKLGEN